MKLLSSPALLLVARNLRTSERTIGVFLLRVAVVSAVMVALWMGYGTRSFLGSPGAMLLTWLTWINFLALLLAGISLFPTLIAEEREQRSLSLLRLAGFGATGFLLGQSLSAFAYTLLMFAVQVPFLLLAVALGGTSTKQVALTVLVLTAGAIVIYAAALLAGALAKTTRGASRFALLLVPMVTFLPAWLAPLETYLYGSSHLARLSSHLTPTLLIALRVESVQWADIAPGLGMQLAIAAGAGLLAVLAFDARGDEEGTARPRAAAHRQRRGRYPAGAAAFRALANRGPGKLPWWALSALNHIALAAIILLPIVGRPLGGLGALLPLQSLVAVVDAATSAARSTHTVRKNRVAGLLLLAGGAHTWLQQQRLVRIQVTGVHVLATGLTSLAIAYGTPTSSAHQVFLIIPWLVGACYFADRFGERNGAVYRRAPGAVTLLGGFAIGAIVTIAAAYASARTGSAAGVCLISVMLFFTLGIALGVATKKHLEKLYAE